MEYRVLQYVSIKKADENCLWTRKKRNVINFAVYQETLPHPAYAVV